MCCAISALVVIIIIHSFNRTQTVNEQGKKYKVDLYYIAYLYLTTIVDGQNLTVKPLHIVLLFRICCTFIAIITVFNRTQALNEQSKNFMYTGSLVVFPVRQKGQPVALIATLTQCKQSESN